jgi:hypothetical protein
MQAMCRKCFAPLAERALVCAQCGTPIEDPAPAPASDVQPSIPATPTDFDLRTTGSFASGVRSDLSGIGGWLVLVAISLAIAPLRSIHGIYVTLHVLYGSQFQHLLSLRPGLAGLITYEVACNSIFLISLIALNYLFYLRKKSFPGMMIAFFVLQAALTLIDHIVTIHFYPHHSAVVLIGNILAAAIWIPYYLSSERVKATFVE